MQPIHITYEQVRGILEEIVNERPDYIYPRRVDGWPDTPTSCLYFHNGEPDCIIGHLLTRLGVPKDQIIEGKGARTLFNSLFLNRIIQADGLQEGHRIVGLVSTVQRYQDQRYTWKESLKQGFKMDPA